MLLRNYFRKKLREQVSRGIIVLDKQSGLTSHDEVARLRAILGTRKVGHSGTLDPKVTGVLVCGLGKGTKVLEYVLLSQKIYNAEIVFHRVVSHAECVKVLEDFTGVISQLPPVKSRVKRVERDREVYRLTLLDFATDGRTAHIRCEVERGTYIRKLCHDIGVRLGGGAHMGELRRIQAGPCSLENSHIATTKQLTILKKKSAWPLIGWWYVYQTTRFIEPIERVLGDLRKVEIHNETVRFIRGGSDLFVPGVLSCDDHIGVGDTVQVVDQEGQVVMIGQAQISGGEMVTNSRGVAVRVQKVLL